MDSAYHMVLCTCPDQDTALNIANALVDNKLAACVNIVPGLRSVYRWKGARARRFPRVRNRPRVT